VLAYSDRLDKRSRRLTSAVRMFLSVVRLQSALIGVLVLFATVAAMTVSAIACEGGGAIIWTGGNPNFGNVKINTTKEETFTFETTAEVEFTGFRITPLRGNAFTRTANSCTGTHLAMFQCSIKIRFAPTAQMEYKSELELLYKSPPGGPVTTTLSFPVYGVGTP